jgi:hypothetical protein
MTSGERVFYECGATVSCETFSPHICQVLVKSCWNSPGHTEKIHVADKATAAQMRETLGIKKGGKNDD